MPAVLPGPEVYRPLHWRQLELTVEDCRAFRMRNTYHFTANRYPLTQMEWAEIGIDLRLWIQCATFARILEIFGLGDPADLEHVRGYLFELMDGRKSAGTKHYKGGAARKAELRGLVDE